MRLLVTGGAGYIGSHAALALLEAGHTVVVVDSLERGCRASIATLGSLGGGRFHFEEMDVRETAKLTSVLRDHAIDAVLHFAALAYVGESVTEPLRYYDCNVGGGISLLRAMVDAKISRIIFSSSCATYGAPTAAQLPLREDAPQVPVNPFGDTKLVMEGLLRSACASGTPLAAAALRYFNVAGADAQCRIGEQHQPETHLIPITLEVALGRRSALTIFGDDYPTQDGTCIRDYVHVSDLVDAHLAALAALEIGQCKAWNVGLGCGHSVRDVVESCRRVSARRIDVQFAPRRAGDPAVLYADPSAIKRDLGWHAKFSSLDAITASAWKWMNRGSVPTA